MTSSREFHIKVSIHHKILLFVLLLVFMAVGGTTYFSVHTEYRVLKEGLIDSGRDRAKHIAVSTQSAFWSLNWIFVERLLQDPALYRNDDVLYAQVIKPDGEVYLASDKRYYGHHIPKTLLSPTELVLEDQRLGARQEPGILFVHPVKIGNDLWYVHLGLALVGIRQAAYALVWKNAMWGGLVLIVSLALSFPIARSITLPLRRFSHATKTIAAGDREYRVDIQSQDEVGMLSHSFNRMIDQLTRAQDELTLSNERFQTVLNSIPADIYVADMATYEILFINRHMRDGFGGNLTGEICFQAFRRRTEPCTHCSNDRLLDAQGKPAGVFVWEGQNPVTGKWYVNYDRAIQWVDGRYVRLQIAMDVSDRKKAEDGLKRVNDELEERVAERTREIELANKELQVEIQERKKTEAALTEAKLVAEAANTSKSEFLATMSHELRTPLNHIIGFTEIVADQKFGQLNPRQITYLENVLQSSQHLLSLINDILDLSKVEAGKMELDCDSVVLKSLLDNSLIMIKERVLLHHLQVDMKCQGIPETIQADERKLKQIMYNLLSNAVKFTPNGGKIQLEALMGNDGHGEQLEISVADTGIGLEESDCERIFEPFEQVDGSTSRHFEGTGLGLPLTRSYVELHGGRIWAESKGPGQGSTFRFTLPLKHPSPHPVIGREAIP